MLVSYKILALRLALLIEESGKKRLTISERRLKTLASAEHKKPAAEKDEESSKEMVLSIRYLSNLRDELELLGYFIGSLAGGGYGLLVISSLDGSFPLAVEVTEADDLFKLNERGLQRILDGKLEQKTQRRKKDTTVTRYEINSYLWEGLADLAKKSLPIVYKDLAEKLKLKNAHYNTFKRPLEQITAFCKEQGLPLLSHLVVLKSTALPPLIALNDENIQLYKEEVEKIADVDWNELQTSFEAFVKTKRKQST